MEKKHKTATGIPGNSTSLQQLVNNLVQCSRSAASLHNTQLVNKVGQGIALGSTMKKAMAVISDLLSTVVANSKNGEIHIRAERYRDVVILEIQERNNYNGYALAYSIGSIEPDAASLGGHISMRGPQQKETTISFSFPDRLNAA